MSKTRTGADDSLRGPDDDRPSFVDVAASMTDGGLKLPCVGNRVTSNYTPRLHRERRQWWNDLTTRFAPHVDSTTSAIEERTHPPPDEPTNAPDVAATQTFETLPGSAIVRRLRSAVRFRRRRRSPACRAKTRRRSVSCVRRLTVRRSRKGNALNVKTRRSDTSTVNVGPRQRTTTKMDLWDGRRISLRTAIISTSQSAVSQPTDQALTPEQGRPLDKHKGLTAAHRAPRCRARSSRTGQPCRKPGTTLA
jgi:hypothetical protein